MINTEVCLFVQRTEIELEHIHNKLRVLMALAEDNGIADCIDTAENMVSDVRDTAKNAAMQIDSIGGSLWSRMYNLEQEQEKAAKAAAAECKGCGCDSEELADYGCNGCSCSKADEAEGGELNG